MISRYVSIELFHYDMIKINIAEDVWKKNQEVEITYIFRRLT